MSDVLFANSDQVASKVMDGEAILINLTTGVYYSLDDTGGVIWSLIEGGTTADAIVQLLSSRYGRDAEVMRADVAPFVAGLVEEGLVLASTEANAGSIVDVAMPDAWNAPQMEKFTDMADMFALDPPLPGLAEQSAG